MNLCESRNGLNISFFRRVEGGIFEFVRQVPGGVPWLVLQEWFDAHLVLQTGEMGWVYLGLTVD